MNAFGNFPCEMSQAASDLEHYGRDWTRQLSPAPSAIAFPQSIKQLQAVVRWANDHGVALVPSGGRTGLSGGAVAARGEVVVSMERMRSILDFDAIGRTITVEAGATTQRVQDAASERGLLYPVDFASRGSSQIGGNIATNAGGIKVLRYGLTRDWVAGLKVVTGSGEILDLNRGLTKNATGYDFRHLFIGSEGTLGVIAEATLRLTDRPPRQQVLVIGLSCQDALMRAFVELRDQLNLSAFEFFTETALRHVLASGARRPFDDEAPFYILAEFDEDEAAALAVFESLAATGVVVDGVLGESQAQSTELWRLREGITESIAKYRPYKNDISVRIASVPAFLERLGALFAREYPSFELVLFGHLGDGNLHVSILPPPGMEPGDFLVECGRVTDLLGGVLQQFGGSISAEHGVGVFKKPYLHYTRATEEIALMRRMKRIFDPAGVMNPGKLL